MLSPLPDPETVALHPVRVLMEKVVQRHCILHFRIRKREDRLFDVDAYINLYLIARQDSKIFRCLRCIALHASTSKHSRGLLTMPRVQCGGASKQEGRQDLGGKARAAAVFADV